MVASVLAGDFPFEDGFFAFGRPESSRPRIQRFAKTAVGASLLAMTVAGLSRASSLLPGLVGQTAPVVLLSSRFSRGGSSSSPLTRNQTFSAMLVAWSPMRSMFLAMNSRCVQAVMLRASSIM
jgi:hypothetical protein